MFSTQKFCSSQRGGLQNVYVDKILWVLDPNFLCIQFVVVDMRAHKMLSTWATGPTKWFRFYDFQVIVDR